ncbi:unnamed protein product, partial [Lymnaea stagnalis]
NCLNIIVYLRLGLRDSISVCFFLLSCSDLICVTFMIPADYLYLFTTLLPTSWRVDGYTISLLIVYYYAPFYDVSQAITTFIAVQRCWCVALPLRFRRTFTRSRTVVATSLTCVACLALYAPVYASIGLQGAGGLDKNETFFIFWTSPDWTRVFSARCTTALVLTTVCQVTVLVCLAVLTSSLRASSNFRSSMQNLSVPIQIAATKNLKNFPKQILKITHSTQPYLETEIPVAPFHTQIQIQRSELPQKESETVTSGFRSRKNTSRNEVQLVKSTSLVSFIFALCNTPKLLIFYASLCEPEFNMHRRYENTFYVANTIRFTCEALNAASNIFVYLKCNKRFKTTLVSSFCLGRE